MNKVSNKLIILHVGKNLQDVSEFHIALNHQLSFVFNYWFQLETKTRHLYISQEFCQSDCIADGIQ